MPPHREPTTVAAARRRLAALTLLAGVVLALGPGSAALAERVARAAETGSPAPTPAPRSPGPGSLDPGPPGPGPPQPGLPEPGPPGPGSGVGASQGPERVPPLRMPLAGPIVRGFEVPAGTYGPGHRGVDVGGRMGEAVRAPAGGRVEFAGPVAGRTWVSLLVAPGVTVTVGPLLDVRVTAGQRVRALAPVGRLGPGHGRTSHLSLRVDGVYVDPLPYLLDRPRPRLAPLLRPGGLAAPEPGPG
jgi:murein DD-endopeptidase MepM/ murein hydrolase activator NlpD